MNKKFNELIHVFLCFLSINIFSGCRCKEGDVTINFDEGKYTVSANDTEILLSKLNKIKKIQNRRLFLR